MSNSENSGLSIAAAIRKRIALRSQTPSLKETSPILEPELEEEDFIDDEEEKPIDPKLKRRSMLDAIFKSLKKRELEE